MSFSGRDWDKVPARYWMVLMVGMFMLGFAVALLLLKPLLA